MEEMLVTSHEEAHNIEAKIVILGEQNVGKTSFVVVGVFKTDSNAPGKTCSLDRVSSTIGASFVSLQVQVDDHKSVKMQIWDTAGQERFRSMAPLYYRKANAAVVMYDVSQGDSFRAAKSWVQELKRNVEVPVLILLVGNKSDLSEQRTVSYEEGLSYAASVGAIFCETSAVTDQGVCEAFSLLAKHLLAYEQEHANFEYRLKADDYVRLDHEDDLVSRSSCC